MTTKRSDDLPLLPGYRVMDVTRTNFAKSHAFDKKPGKGIVVNLDAPGIGGTLLPGQKPKVAHTSRSISKVATRDSDAPSTEPEQTPAYIAFDRKVLCFTGYFQEGVTESRTETYRYRKIKLYCYLEDDSMQISEIKQDNSGMPQGTFIRRHMFPKPGKRGEYYKWEDFDLGQDYEIYGVTYHLCDCDPFTRNFYEKVGQPLSAPEELPHDAWEADVEAKRPHPRHSSGVDVEKLALRQFIRYDRKVLRFYGVWDDRSESFGDLRQLIVHYYLSDDTLEVNEVKKNNSGYLDFPVFVRRQRVPKKFVGSSSATGTGAADLPKTACISAADLMVGRTVSIFCRPILLYDCDAFTRKYYTDTYGVTEFPTVELPKSVAVVPEREIPPWNGIGSEEDTMQTVLMLNPKPAKKDFQKQIAFEGVKFSYKARLIDCKPTDALRRFILCSYPSDDTISMFEPEDRNSGTVVGKFLDRGRFKADDGDGTSYIKPTDLHIGQVVHFLGKHVLLYDADDFTLHYKLGHSDSDSLTVLPMLDGYPIQPNVEAALDNVRKTLTEAGVTPQQVVALCKSPTMPDSIKLATLRSCLLEWGMEPDENTFLGLTAYFDPEVKNVAPAQEFIDMFS